MRKFIANNALLFHRLEKAELKQMETDQKVLQVFNAIQENSLKTKEKITGKKITVELTDSVTHYTQDDIEGIQQSRRKGSKVVIEDRQKIHNIQILPTAGVMGFVR